MIVPKLNGAPSELTKNSSVLPARLTICGTKNMLMNHKSATEITPARTKPQNEVFVLAQEITVGTHRYADKILYDLQVKLKSLNDIIEDNRRELKENINQ